MRIRLVEPGSGQYAGIDSVVVVDVRLNRTLTSLLDTVIVALRIDTLAPQGTDALVAGHFSADSLGLSANLVDTLTDPTHPGVTGVDTFRFTFKVKPGDPETAPNTVVAQAFLKTPDASAFRKLNNLSKLPESLAILAETVGDGVRIGVDGLRPVNSGSHSGGFVGPAHVQTSSTEPSPEQTGTVTPDVPPGPSPNLVLSTVRMNFGNVVRVGSVGELTFSVRNSGTADLVVSRITPSDTDYTVAPQRVVAALDQETDITVRFHPTIEGDHHANLRLHSNDLDQPVIELRVRATAPAPFLEPDPAPAVGEGDFDGDGLVGFRDFLAFALAFGTADPNYDLDGDGRVGSGDWKRFPNAFEVQNGDATKR